MFIQADRLLSIATPLGDDALLMTAFAGQEQLSRLFHFQLELASEQPIAFDKLLGQNATAAILLPNGDKRFFNGIISRLSTGPRDRDFFYYRAELVPKAWLLTRNIQSRIFQHLSVPDILKKVFASLDVKQELVGAFHPREFCVQYQESDFAFASRLMEEEGIYYFFKHSNGSHQLILANTPQSHPDLEPATILFDEAAGGARDEDRILSWEKTQELRSAKYTLWDHHFELPHKHLEADKTILQSVQVGQLQHKLLCGNDSLEIYEFPGRYAHRYDGVDKGGGDQAAELNKIFEDNKRLAEIRMQQEALPALLIDGSSNCRHFLAGYKFRLERGDAEDGQYVLTSVYHTARQQVSMRGQQDEFFYENRFQCIPVALPFRPQRLTPLPRIYGSQTAVVVGPPGEEIFTDKYGRVKVQFHWDREGKNDPDSSCWIRVSQPWAGKNWGSVAIPRIGQEVVVDFIEGDPDRPIITGKVYNAEQMPPYELPAGKVISGLKSNSTKGGGGYNEISCDDTKGKEKITIHAQYDMGTVVEHDQTTTVHNNRTDKIDVDDSETVGNNQSIAIGSNQNVTIGSNQSTDIGANQTITIGSNQDNAIGAARKTTIGSTDELNVGSNETIMIGANRSVTIAANDGLTVSGSQTITVTGPISITSSANIALTVGGSNITLTPAGVTITAPIIKLN